MRLALLLIITLAFAPLKAQHITGVVSADGIKIAGAKVQLTNKVTYTNDTGWFEFTQNVMGKQLLTVTYPNYQVFKKTITLTSAQPQHMSIELLPANFQIDEVVVSGTLKEVVRSKSVVPVEIFKPTFFKKNPTPNTFESLKMVNGVLPVVTCNVCNTGSISINGLDGPYTMVMIDGMPIVSALSTVYGLNGIPNSMVDRIEIVKGPASTLYGSEAVAGLINIITQRPDQSPRFSFDVFGTTYNEWNLDAGASVKRDKYASIWSMNYFQMQTPWDKNGDQFTDIALQQRFSLFNKWQFYRPSKKMSTLAVRYMFEDRWGGQMNWNESFRGTDSVYGESIYTHRVEVIGMHELGFIKNLKWMYSYNYHDQNSVYGNTPYLAKQHVGFSQLVWNNSYRIHDVTAGLALRYNNYDDNTPATQIAAVTGTSNMPVVSWLPGFFVQDEIKFNQKHQLLLGSRLDYYQRHGMIFSPRVNYRWRLNENQSIRLSAGNGFRVVNLFTEEHAALTGARKIEVKNTLQPEQSYNVNINYALVYPFSKGVVNIDVSPFYTYFTNRIIADYDTDPDKIIYDNINGYAVSRGVSVNADLSLTNGFKLNAGGTVLDVFRADQSTGTTTYSRLVYAPEWMSTLLASYLYEKWDVQLDYTSQVYGSMRLPVLENDFRPEYSPVYAIHNIQVTKLFHNGLAFYGGVKNLFNFMPVSPLMRPFDPFDKRVNDAVNNPNNYSFDAGYNYAPVQGVRFFFGVRYAFK